MTKRQRGEQARRWHDKHGAPCNECGADYPWECKCEPIPDEFADVPEDVFRAVKGACDELGFILGPPMPNEAHD